MFRWNLSYKRNILAVTITARTSVAGYTWHVLAHSSRPEVTNLVFYTLTRDSVQVSSYKKCKHWRWSAPLRRENRSSHNYWSCTRVLIWFHSRMQSSTDSKFYITETMLKEFRPLVFKLYGTLAYHTSSTPYVFTARIPRARAHVRACARVCVFRIISQP